MTRRAVFVLFALVGGVASLVLAPAARAADHAVFAYGDAAFHGSTGNVALNHPVVGMARTPIGDGYWLAARDGRVFAFGAARHHGSVDSPTPSPVVGIAATPTGGGYWLATANGSIYTFGDAAFLGSLGNVPLAEPIVGIAATPSGGGYWLVAEDGGIFTFGTAPFLGSTGAINLNQPITGMAATKSGGGYWLVARDGGIFTFGDAVFRGSLGGTGLTEPAVGIVSSKSGQGYWIVTTGHLAQSATANAPQRVIQPGSYRVSGLGPVVPGTYRALYATKNCHWERAAAFDGSTGSVLASITSSHRQVVTIKDTDQSFRTSGCAPFVNELFPITQSQFASFGDGVWIVDTDVAPGTWSAPGGDTCEWSRVNDFSWEAAALKASDSGAVNPVVTIDGGDAGFVSDGCGTWTRR